MPLNSPTPPRAVVFDLDGTMFNSEELYLVVGQKLLQRHGHTLDQQLVDDMMGLPSGKSLQIMIDRHSLDTTVDTLREETDDIFSHLIPDQLEPMPGLLDLLDAIEKLGLPKCVATSSRRNYTLSTLGKFDLVDRFEFLLTEEDIVHGKPDPEIYLKSAEKFNMSPDELLVLEDSRFGSLAATRAGCRVIAVPGEHSLHHDYSHVNVVASSLADPIIYKALGISRP